MGRRRRDRLRAGVGALGMLGALVVNAACSTAGGPAPAEAVQLEVTGSHPIAGHDDHRFLAVACDGPSSTNDTPTAIAATAGSTISMAMTRQRCAGDARLAAAACHWRIEPSATACAADPLAPVAGSATIEGSGGMLGVTLPPRTGVYELSLQCTAADGAAVMPPTTVALYATYGKPLFLAAEPAESLYRLGASWGCGFRTDAPETDVLVRMLDGLYHHGRQHWRYGSFDPPAQSAYEPYDEGGGWTSCPWQALATGDACNFADCYEFSQVFEHVAATHGIGVFEPVADIGARAGGFLTRDGSQALDPGFPGNVDCEADGKCSGYVFNSHSIRFRDGIYYDATFNATYQSAGQFIAASAIRHEDHSVTLMGNDISLAFEGEGYGRWPQYRTRVAPGTDAAMTPMLDLMPAADIIVSSVAQTASSLVINARVRLDSAGTFAVRGLLIRDDREQRTVVSASPDASPADSSVIVQGPGQADVSLQIPYRSITLAGGAGTYEYRVEVFALQPPAAGTHGHVFGAMLGRLSATTNISREVLEDTSDEPQILGVEIADEQPAEGSAGRFVARFRLLVPGAGGYLLQARLSREGETLAYAGDARGVESRDPGVTTVMLELPFDVPDPASLGGAPVKLTAELIQKNDADAPYEDSIAFASFFLQLQDGTLRVLDAGS